MHYFFTSTSLHLNAVLWGYRTGEKYRTWWNAHCDRLVSLYIRRARVDVSLMNHLLEVMKRPAPLLESLSIEELEIYNDGDLPHPALELKQYRHLKRLTLDCGFLPRQELEDILSLTNLTHLFLKLQEGDIFHVLFGFTNSPFLEVLILEAIEATESADGFSYAPVVCLPVLKHLETLYIRHLAFIDHLVVPSTTTIITTPPSTEEAPLSQARLDTMQTLDVKYTRRNTLSLCFLSDTSVMVESDMRRNVLLPLLSTWFPNIATLDVRLLSHSAGYGDMEGTLMCGIIGWIGLRRLIFNEIVDYFRLIDILDISGTWTFAPQLNDYREDGLTKNMTAPISPLLQEVVVWEVPADFESEYEGVHGSWKYREPGRYEIERPQPALKYTLVVRAQTRSGIRFRPSFRWTETDRY